MESEQYLDRMLKKYAPTFDIFRPYQLGGREYAAYLRFSSRSEKYVLVKQANLWTADSFEHVLVLSTDACTADTIADVRDAIEQHMEPMMVRNGEKYPPENHMYTYLTAIVLCKEQPAADVLRLIRDYRFVRNYLFTVRGRAEAHLVVVDAVNEQVWANRPAAKSAAVYRDLFGER